MRCKASPWRRYSPIGTSTARNALSGTPRSARRVVCSNARRYDGQLSGVRRPQQCLHATGLVVHSQGDSGIRRSSRPVIRGWNGSKGANDARWWRLSCKFHMVHMVCVGANALILTLGIINKTVSLSASCWTPALKHTDTYWRFCHNPSLYFSQRSFCLSACSDWPSDRSSPLSLRPGDPIRQTENRATRCKVERLQLLMQQKRLRRKARRDQRAPYQWLPNRKAGRSNSNSSMSSEGSLDLDFDDSVWKPDVKADLKSEFVMAWTAGSCGMDSNGCAKCGDLPRDTFWGSGSAPSVSKGVLCDEEMGDHLAAGNMKQKPRLPQRP